LSFQIAFFNSRVVRLHVVRSTRFSTSVPASHPTQQQQHQQQQQQQQQEEQPQQDLDDGKSSGVGWVVGAALASVGAYYYYVDYADKQEAEKARSGV